MRKVALIGTAPLSRSLAPYNDETWEIWVCSAGNIGAPGLNRVSRWFELHANVELDAQENKQWADNYIEWLRRQTFPVWTLEKNDRLPQAQIFPCKELLKEFGREWFTSSIAWMQALAIYEKVDEMGIFGVDMAADQEHYTGQRMGCRRFIEIAKERGIPVSIPWESCLGNPPPIYGLWEATPMGRRINVTEQMLTSKRAEIDTGVKRAEIERAFFDGAIEQLRYFKRTFVDGADAFQHMDLGDLDAAAKATVDRIAGKAEPPKFDLPTGTSVGVSNLTPPPSMEDEPMEKADVLRELDALRKGNGASDPHPYVGHPKAKRTRQRASQGQGEAI